MTVELPDDVADNTKTYFVKGTVSEEGLVQGVWPARVVVQYPGEGFRVAWLTSFWVPYNWRRRGVGAAMLKHVVGLIHAKGFDASLAALPYDPSPEERMPMADLVAWYQRNGFTTLEGNILISRAP